MRSATRAQRRSQASFVAGSCLVLGVGAVLFGGIAALAAAAEAKGPAANATWAIGSVAVGAVVLLVARGAFALRPWARPACLVIFGAALVALAASSVALTHDKSATDSAAYAFMGTISWAVFFVVLIVLTLRSDTFQPKAPLASEPTAWPDH